MSRRSVRKRRHLEAAKWYREAMASLEAACPRTRYPESMYDEVPLRPIAADEPYCADFSRAQWPDLTKS